LPVRYLSLEQAMKSHLVLQVLGYCATLALLVFGVLDSRDYYLKVLPYMLKELPAPDAGSENLSIASFFYSTNHWHLAELSPAGMRVAKTIFSGMLVIALWLLYRRTAKLETMEWVEAGLLLPAIVLFLTNSWANYQLLLLLPICIAVTQKEGPRAPIFWAAIGSFLLCAYHQNVHYHFQDIFPNSPEWFDTWQICRVLASISCFLSMTSLALRRTGKMPEAARS
jgi:hypothetical protein